MSDHYRLEADYYRDFHCKCGACRNTCCSGWNIAVSMTEYFRLIGMDCSEQLHRRLEAAFIMPSSVSPEHFRVIGPNWRGDCPMLNEQGLCALQLECGETAIPEVCRMYPRGTKCVDGRERACCTNSCEAVIELLTDRDSLSFRLMPADERCELNEHSTPGLVREEGRCVLLLRDRSKPLRTRIESIVTELTGEAPAVPRDIAQGLRDTFEALRAMEDNSVRLADALAALEERGLNDPVRCAAALADFETANPDWERVFENVLINHIVYTDFPRTDERIAPVHSVRGLCLAWAMMRLFCAAAGPEREGLVDMLSGVFHLIEHSPFYYNANILAKDPAPLLAL